MRTSQIAFSHSLTHSRDMRGRWEKDTKQEQCIHCKKKKKFPCLMWGYDPLIKPKRVKKPSVLITILILKPWGYMLQ